MTQIASGNSSWSLCERWTRKWPPSSHSYVIQPGTTPSNSGCVASVSHVPISTSNGSSRGSRSVMPVLSCVAPADCPLGRAARTRPAMATRPSGRPVRVTGSVKAAPGMTLMTWGRSSAVAIHDRCGRASPRGSPGCILSDMTIDDMLDSAAGGAATIAPGWGQGRATYGGLVAGLLVARAEALWRRAAACARRASRSSRRSRPVPRRSTGPCSGPARRRPRSR